MMGAKLEHLLRGAADEIRSLRRHNEVLAAKVEVMELFACVLRTQPALPSRGMSVDWAWEIDAYIERTKHPENFKDYESEDADD